MLLDAILASLSDDKAEDIVTVDLRGRSAFADHMVIASGRSTRQVAAISEKLVERLKSLTGERAKVEGKDAGDWVLVDAGDVIVHVFRPEVREFYQLEKMWLPAESAVQQHLMRVQISAVGRLRAGPEKDLISDYLTRFDRTGRGLGLGPTEIVEVEDKKGGGKRPEAQLLAKSLPEGAVAIALDERGRKLTSPDLAELLARERDGGCSHLAFVIGGADGLDRALVKSCNMSLSLGAMVWPHMLVRVMLAEQLYRAATILAGTPYHRS